MAAYANRAAVAPGSARGPGKERVRGAPVRAELSVAAGTASRHPERSRGSRRPHGRPQRPFSILRIRCASPDKSCTHS
jgi:hypothetical protein